MVSYIKGGMQTKGIWKENLEAIIWAQKGSRDDSTVRKFIIRNAHLI
jgi:hypothetical protein